MRYLRGLCWVGGIIWVGLDRTELNLNRSQSLPYAFFITVKDLPAHRGSLACIKGHQPQYIPFTPTCIKHVVGLPGDRYEARGPHFYINGKLAGSLRTHTRESESLTPLQTGIIPKGYVFVMGRSWDSFDSRYEEFGLVNQAHLQGQAFGFGKRGKHV